MSNDNQQVKKTETPPPTPPQKKMSKHQREMNKYELYDADPNCDHFVVDAPGGGVKCTKCPGWFCY